MTSPLNLELAMLRSRFFTVGSSRVAAVLAAACLVLSAPAFAQDAGSSYDPDCTIANQSLAGSTCAECIITASDTSCAVELGSDYNAVCTQSQTPTQTVQIWCNGPDRIDQPETNATSCSLPASGPSLAGGAGGLFVALGAIALAFARRRRG